MAFSCQEKLKGRDSFFSPATTAPNDEAFGKHEVPRPDSRTHPRKAPEEPRRQRRAQTWERKGQEHESPYSRHVMPKATCRPNNRVMLLTLVIGETWQSKPTLTSLTQSQLRFCSQGCACQLLWAFPTGQARIVNAPSVFLGHPQVWEGPSPHPRVLQMLTRHALRMLYNNTAHSGLNRVSVKITCIGCTLPMLERPVSFFPGFSLRFWGIDCLDVLYRFFEKQT